MGLLEKYGLKPRVVALLALLFLGFVVLLWWFLPKPGPSLPEVETTSPTSESEFAVAEATPTETAVAEETPTPEATPTATPTATATPKPTATPTPTHTPTPTPTFTPTPTPTPEAVIEFGADDTSIVASNCTNLWWNVENIKEVYLIRGGEPPEGVAGGNQTREVCLGDDTTFILQVTKLDNSVVEKSVTIAVDGRLVNIIVRRVKINNNDMDSDGKGDVQVVIKLEQVGAAYCYLPPGQDTWQIGQGETFKVPSPSGECWVYTSVEENIDIKLEFTFTDVDLTDSDDLLGSAQAVHPFSADWEGGNPYTALTIPGNNVEVTYLIDIVDIK